jgi:uncharacterized membrane protein
LRPPAPGQFVEALLEDWPAYLAYLIAFLTIGSIWLSHHDTFTRIRRADPRVLVLNLVLLLGASLVPWPTALISTAVGEGSHQDKVAAILVYALVTVIVSVPWSLLSAYLARRPHLLETDTDCAWMRRNMWQSAAAGAVGVVGAAIALLVPLVSLLLFLVVPSAFLISRARATQAAAE